MVPVNRFTTLPEITNVEKSQYLPGFVERGVPSGEPHVHLSEGERVTLEIGQVPGSR